MSVASGMIGGTSVVSPYCETHFDREHRNEMVIHSKTVALGIPVGKQSAL